MSKGDKKIPVAAIYMNIGNGNEIFPNFDFLSILAVLCRKSCKIRVCAMDIDKVIHKNGINDYSPAFRTHSYRLTSVIRGRPNKSEIG